MSGLAVPGAGAGSHADPAPGTRLAWVRSARLADGRLVDVELRDGVVRALHAPGAVPPEAAADPRDQGDPRHQGDPGTVLDAGGRLLLPAFVEPHAHLDKALLPLPVRGPGLGPAVEAVIAAYPDRSVPEIAERVVRAAREHVRHGVGTLRTHADALPAIGTRAVEAVAAAGRALHRVLELQVVALSGVPLTGAAGAANRAALLDALDAGAGLVGGAPWLDPDPAAAVDVLLAVAADRGLGVDLHVDETTDPAVDTLSALVRGLRSGFAHPVTASHAVALGAATPERQAAVAADLADVGVGVVALPRTNLWLQQRERRQGATRGLTAVRALLDAGVALGVGTDNLRDVFNPYGPADPLDVARLFATVVEASTLEAATAITGGAARVVGAGSRSGPVVGVGDRADLVLVDETDLESALARTPAGRTTVHAGVVVAVRALDEAELGVP